MNKRKMSLRVRIIYAIGLLFAALNPIFLTHFVKLPDFVRGAFTGIGIGLCIVALVFYSREKSACGRSSREHLMTDGNR